MDHRVSLLRYLSDDPAAIQLKNLSYHTRTVKTGWEAESCDFIAQIRTNEAV